ncbi:hypothetical protein C8A01DRAFT_12331, partial [Parachaetomium inaequale]
MLTLGHELTELLRAQRPIASEVDSKLSRLVDEFQVTQKQLRILQSLRYDSMRLREGEVASAHEQTFEWMFDRAASTSPHESRTGFSTWLEAEDGIFWVTGKPGCGKSTLMKFVSHHDTTTRSLQVWAAGKRLVTACFYFWRGAGENLQTKQDGLLRTLLSQIMTECPSLMPKLCPERWANVQQQTEPWTRQELLAAFSKLPEEKLSLNSAFAFFIDGLDEYDGSHEEIAQVVSQLAAPANVKICIASRDLPTFDHHFGSSAKHERRRKLILHEHTKADIMRFVQDKLGGDQRYRDFMCRQQHELGHDTLVNEITSRAQGMFIWVRIACEEVVKGLTHQDTPDILAARLETVPTDLEILYTRIIERVDPIYQRMSARILLLLLAA